METQHTPGERLTGTEWQDVILELAALIEKMEAQDDAEDARAAVAETVTVHVNDTVRMHNGDAILHDIEPLSAGNPGWGAIAGGANIDTKLTAAGTFTYVCAVPGHNMVGTLIVAP